MVRIHWFLIALFLQFKVNIEGAPSGTVTCGDDHTVNITISNVDDLDAFTASNWQINNNNECNASLSGTTVTYTNLPVSTCASSSQERDNDILYIFEIRALAPGSGPIQAFDHSFDASCAYDNNETVTASFVPLTKKEANASDTAAFAFNLAVFSDADFTTSLAGAVALNLPLYFKVDVQTSSDNPNLDLFILSCHSSKSNAAASNDGKVVLIENGCGNKAVSQDAGDTLSFNCTDNSTVETFSIDSFRYFGVDAGEPVFVHCEVKVCLEDNPSSTCKCPSDAECDPNAARKRRAVEEFVIFRITKGPYYFVDETEKMDDDGGLDETEAEDKGIFYLNLSIILAVSGIVISAIACLTVFLILRKRQQRFSLTDKNTPAATNVKT